MYSTQESREAVVSLYIVVMKPADAKPIASRTLLPKGILITTSLVLTRGFIY